MDDKFIAYVERRLEQWADWFSRGNFYGLGYPACSIEYRLMKEGNISKSNGPKPLQINESAEEIEKLVKEMSEQNSDMALALRCHYFTRGGWRTKSEKVKISHMQFKYFVAMAHQWLAGRLSEKIKLK